MYEYIRRAGIAQCLYWLGYEPPGYRGSIPGRGRDVYFLHRIQTGSVAHPASCLMTTEGSFPGVQMPGLESDPSSPSSAEVKYALRLHSSVRLHGEVLN
jgi:hypothetical protein